MTARITTTLPLLPGCCKDCGKGPSSNNPSNMFYALDVDDTLGAIYYCEDCWHSMCRSVNYAKEDQVFEVNFELTQRVNELEKILIDYESVFNGLLDNGVDLSSVFEFLRHKRGDTSEQPAFNVGRERAQRTAKLAEQNSSRRLDKLRLTTGPSSVNF